MMIIFPIGIARSENSVILFWKDRKIYLVEIEMLPVIIVKMTITASLGLVKPSLCSLTDCYFKF